MKSKKSPSLDRANIESFSMWRGLGGWNFYFIAKLALYWAGYLNFNVFYNGLFMAVLLVPLPPLWLHRLRHIVAIPFGVALLYYDSWFPPFRRLLEQPEVLQFSNAYLFELLGRFINWELVGAGFILWVAYLFLSQWLRLSVFTVVALFSVGVAQSSLPGLPRLQWDPVTVANTDEAPKLNSEFGSTPQITNTLSLDERLNNELALFYQAEQERRIDFSSLDADSADFDLLFLNICSLSWADLEATGLSQHPLFQKMDVLFENFNSVTSYSGPAVSRLMQANCGQLPHDALYEPVGAECSLFSSLHSLGFETSAALNHNGQFQGFIEDIISEPVLSSPLVPTELKPTLRGFDESPIWSDYETLHLWLENQQRSNKTESAALLYNSITLHDGNREATREGGSRFSPYEVRAQQLLDDLDRFMDELERSGRRAVVVFVPEHGAALEGDRMQISGMREIPTAAITRVPVGVRVFGTKANPPTHPIQISEPTSFLALSELVSRFIKDSIFDQESLNWERLTANLAQTPAVSENEGIVFMQYEGTPYVRLNGKNWVRYEP